MGLAPHVNGPGEVKPLVNRPNTSVARRRRQHARRRLGFRPQATKRTAERLCVELGVRRIQGSTREGLGWPESSPASTLAVAGARVSSGSMLRWVGWLVRGTYVLYTAWGGS